MSTTKALFRHAATAERLDVLGSAMTLLATESDTGGRYEVVVVDAGPGGDIVPHRHPWEEFYFVLEGVLEVQVGAQIHRATAGALVTMPAKALHGFRVVSERARFLHVSHGVGATAAFRDYAAELPASPGVEDFETILQVNARHGVTLVLPPELQELLTTS